MDHQSFDFSDFGLLPQLAKTKKCLEAFIQKSLQANEVDLTPKQVVVLNAIATNGPFAQNDLAFITNRNKATLARFISTLEKRNLIARIPSERDKRINLVHITTQGQKLLNLALPIFKRVVQELEEELSQTELNQTSETLSKLLDKINRSNTSCTSN